MAAVLATLAAWAGPDPSRYPPKSRIAAVGRRPSVPGQVRLATYYIVEYGARLLLFALAASLSIPLLDPSITDLVSSYTTLLAVSFPHILAALLLLTFGSVTHHYGFRVGVSSGNFLFRIPEGLVVLGHQSSWGEDSIITNFPGTRDKKTNQRDEQLRNKSCQIKVPIYEQDGSLLVSGRREGWEVGI